MAKVDIGSMFHIGHHNDADGRQSDYLRSAHSRGGNRAFRACVAEKIRGAGGDWRSRRAKLGGAAKSCAGVRRGR